MFKYEDMDYQSLSTSLDIENPDGPEELYALAQFCRIGKGVQASEENYRLYLQRAADAGSAQARQELDALTNAAPAAAARSAAQDTASMTLPELLQAADSGNPYALLPLAEKALTKELLDLPKAKAWLEKAAALAPQGVYSDADATKIYLTLARLLTSKTFDTPENRELSHRYFGLAAELGSEEACDALADQYERGYGCEPDADKAKLYRSRGVLNNDPAYLCRQCCKLLTEGGSRMDVVVTLNRIRSMTQDADVLACADLLTAAAGQTAVTPELAAWGWEHLEQEGEDKSVVSISCQLLAMIYGNDPQAAVAKGLPVDGNKTGKLADFMTDDNACFTWAKYGAENGNPSAQSVLANCYRKGRGTAVDAEQCIAWAKKAADAGNAFAYYVLGMVYLYDDSVCDYQDALYWWQTAAMVGYEYAYYNIGYIYENGLGVEQDYAKAVENYEIGARLGDERAQDLLGDFYAEGRGVPQDYAKAVELYQKAAAQGNEYALNSLAVCYENGQGVPQDYAKAAELFKEAADKGNDIAMANLGGYYSRGRGVPQDYGKANELYRKAAELGDVRSYESLAMSYAFGKGVQQDYTKAAELLQKAIDMGDVDAAYMLGLLYEAGYLDAENKSDYAKAAALFQQAAEHGTNHVGDAMEALAGLYEEGDGVPQDDTKAEEYHQAAADAGNEKAKEWLANHKTGKLLAWVRKYMPVKGDVVAYGGEIGLLVWPSFIFFILTAAFISVKEIANVFAIIAVVILFAAGILALKIVVTKRLKTNDPRLTLGVLLTPVMLIRAAIGAFQKKK